MQYNLIYDYWEMDIEMYNHVLFHDVNDWVDMENCYACKEEYAYLWFPQWLDELDEVYDETD